MNCSCECGRNLYSTAVVSVVTRQDCTWRLYMGRCVLPRCNSFMKIDVYFTVKKMYICIEESLTPNTYGLGQYERASQYTVNAFTRTVALYNAYVKKEQLKRHAITALPGVICLVEIRKNGNKIKIYILTYTSREMFLNSYQTQPIIR